MIRVRLALFAFALISVKASGSGKDLAQAFGSRESIEDISLSPDGGQVAYLGPLTGQGSGLYVAKTDGSEAPRRVAVASGNPDRLGDCSWTSNDRLVCSTFGISAKAGTQISFNKLVLLSSHPDKSGEAKPALSIGSGRLIRSPEGDEASLLVARTYVGSSVSVAIDRVDTKTGASKTVDSFPMNSIDLTTDETGKVRVLGFRVLRDGVGNDSGNLTFRFNSAGGHDWKPFGVYNQLTREGFYPLQADSQRNIVWGMRKLNGRLAVYTKALDEAGAETLIFSHPEVDADRLLFIGPRHRVIGVSYVTDRRRVEYLDPAMKALSASLSRAVPDLPIIDILDASSDERKLLIRASSDVDAGRYYILNRDTKQLRILMLSRPELDSVKLAPVKTVSFSARDGVSIPAYLTLPLQGTRNLPAIVMPHGGPWARDEWGFDWLAQYFAARGYAVLQPNFRGSAGYGDSFRPYDGFRNWRLAIGDITDGARWLLSQNIADPKRLVIFGWSFGGYAALQAAATDPELFRAVVAVAPVTDVRKLLAESNGYSDHYIMTQLLGSGSNLDDASPVKLAGRMSAPIMLVHGKLDQNVAYEQSERMANQLRKVGRPAKFITFDQLDHQLADAAARARLLTEADQFISATVDAPTSAAAASGTAIHP